MRVFLALLPLLACAASSHAQGGGVIGGLAGSIDNAVEAASLQAAAKVLTGGAYTITNVATGQALTYEADGNHITPEDGDGTPVNILGYGGGVSWVRLQIGEKDKCMSAQWGGSYNLAGVMYACAVDEGGDVTRADNTLEPTKQWWLLVPVGSDLDSTSSHSNNVLFAAQSESVATRQKAHKNGIVAHFNKKNGRRSLHGGSASSSSSSNRLELVSRAPAKRTRKKWFEKGKGSTTQKKAASKPNKKAASSKPKPKASKKVAAPKPKKKVVSKAKSKPKPKAPANKKKTTMTKAKKVSSSSKKKTTSSSKKPASSVVGVKLNVAVNRKYWIIPVDHLIDMHTLALTGHQIDSFRAQSTALDLWDANDKYQQWTIERA